MTGDAWRVIDAFGGSGITISPNTVLEFEFRSSDVSQVVGIGFDKNQLTTLTTTTNSYPKIKRFACMLPAGIASAGP